MAARRKRGASSSRPTNWGHFVAVEHGSNWWPYHSEDGESILVDGVERPMRCPYGKPGDRLWVREKWTYEGESLDAARASHEDMMPGLSGGIDYYASESIPEIFPRWYPSIHMPRWASRITLEITGARMERLQDMGNADAIAEGAPDSLRELTKTSRPLAWFIRLWESINGPAAWDANPWVWVIEFKRIAP
jgi:hypothetical protein